MKNKSNFKDPETGEEFFFPTIISGIKDGKPFYKDKWRKELINDKTNNKLVPIPTEGPITVPMVSKFNPTSVEGQANIKKHFGGRAHKFDTKGAGRDERDQKVKDFKGQIMERAKDGKL